MIAFLTDKRFEVALGAAVAVLGPIVEALYNAWQQGQFQVHQGNALATIVLGLLIAVRAGASHKQSPPQEPVVAVAIPVAAATPQEDLASSIAGMRAVLAEITAFGQAWQELTKPVPPAGVPGDAPQVSAP